MSKLARSIDLFATIERDSDLLSGSKLKMVQVLFEGLCAALSAAQGHGAHRATERKLEALSRAQRILKGLQLSLDKGTTEQIGADLAEIYSYMSARLWHANFHHDAQALEEVLSLTRTLSDGWQKLSRPVKTQFEVAGAGASQMRAAVSYLA